MIPAWFQNAIDTPFDARHVVVEGCRIAYQHWSAPGRPGVILVHGHAAHAHWWDFIAPLLPEYDVVAINLSGAGDSEHREQYRASQFAREIMAVAADAGFIKPVVVGHSFGGSMTRIAAHQHGDALGGIVLVDSVLSPKRASREPPPFRRKRTRYFPSTEEGARRFRLRPPQPATHEFIIDHIARHSLKETPDGFQFKLDPAVFAKMTEPETFPDAQTMVRELTIPTGFIYGENSRFFPPVMVDGVRPLFPEARFTGIPDAWHHVFLDVPQVFTEVLREQLASIITPQ